jgi:hypothetical protein
VAEEAAKAKSVTLDAVTKVVSTKERCPSEHHHSHDPLDNLMHDASRVSSLMMMLASPGFLVLTINSSTLTRYVLYIALTN